LRIRYLTHHSPWPAWSGGAIREAYLLSALSARFAIDVVGICRSSGADASAVVQHLGVRSASFYCDEARRTMRRQRYSAKVKHLFRSESYSLDLVDAVHVEGGYLFHLLPPTHHKRTCLVEHNIESDVLEQFAVLMDDPWLVRASHRVAELEVRAWRSAAAVVAVTPEDRCEIMRRVGRTDVHVVPNGCDHVPAGQATALPPAAPPTALLLANYAYPPNADALHRMLHDLWPCILANLPDARLIVAGSGLSATQRDMADGTPGTDAVGFVDDVSAVLDQADVLVCPLRAGGGVKVKVLESIRRGCPVVTTTIGAQGIHGPARSALHVTDSTAGLIQVTTALLDARHLRAKRRRQTLRAGAGLATWAHASATLASVWSEICVRDG